MRWVSLSFLWFLVVSGTASATTVLLPGETLEVNFALAPPVCPGGPCDTLLVFPSADFAFSPVVDTVRLYDGEDVLGSMSWSYAPVFASADSGLAGGMAAIVDFSSILDGTIEGRITFSLLSGSMAWTGQPWLDLTLGRSIAPGVVMTGSSVVVTNVSITSNVVFAPAALDAPVVSNPEPASVWLGLGGIGAMFALGRFRRRRRAL